jgi:hypothetical protein
VNRRITGVAAAGIVGALLFAAPGFAGSGNGDNNDNGDAYKNKFDDTTTSRTCNTETDADGPDTVGYAGPSLVWPPNHKLAPASVLTATADDDSEGGYDDGENVSLSSAVMSDEPANGTGDGNTAQDVDQAADAEEPDDDGKATTEHQVRAERAGTGDGRTYTIDFTATFEDDLGEYVCTSIAGEDETDGEGRRIVRPDGGAFTVTVPHDMSDDQTREDRNIGQ